MDISGFIQGLADLLTSIGLSESQGVTAAMILVYLAATILLLGVIGFFFRRTRLSRPSRPRGEEAPPPGGAADSEQAPAEVEEPQTAESLPPAIPAPAVPPARVAAEEAPLEPPVSLFDRMRAGLAKTQATVVGRLDALLGTRKVDRELLDEMEEILVTADFGVKTAHDVMQAIEKRLGAGGENSPAALRAYLKEEIRLRLRLEAAPLAPEKAFPFVIVVVGVNGVGKTTTIGKLAWQYVRQGKKVILGAGDTFRAAAAEQLAIWGERSGAEVVRHAEGADPAAVAFDAAKAAVARRADLLILDTAGRLHTKVNLMEELKKVRRVLDREIPGAPHEVLLVLDATTGQNALVQARLFKEAVAVSGIVLTKLDGTARGGIVVAVGHELGIPVRFIGIGERPDDLRPFDPDLFTEALFKTPEAS